MSNTILGREVGTLTFAVDDVVKRNRKFASQKINERLEKLLDRPIEACHDYHTEVCYNHDYHPLLAAVYTAFCQHLPLCLGPDVVWLTISQGIAHHMALHGERLRRRFVQHDGKLELTVEVDGWVPRSPENPWSEAFEGWTGQIKDYVGREIFDSLMCDFSTTDSSSRIASQIVMMDIFETYFKYRVVGICGIPYVTLEGTETDWEHLARKVRSLRCFDIDWWLDVSSPLSMRWLSRGEATSMLNTGGIFANAKKPMAAIKSMDGSLFSSRTSEKLDRDQVVDSETQSSKPVRDFPLSLHQRVCRKFPFPGGMSMAK